MTTVFVLLFGILFFLLSLKKAEWALFAVLAGLPLYTVRFSLMGVPSTLLELMILVLFFAWSIKNIGRLKRNLQIKLRPKNGEEEAERKMIRRYPFDIEVLLVLLVSFLAMGVVGFNNAAMGIWKAYFFEPLLLYILVFNLLFRKDGREGIPLSSGFKKLIFPLSIGVFYVSVFAAYQKFTGNFIPNPLWQASATRRVTAFYGYPNAIGLYFAPLIVLIFSYLVSVRMKYGNGKPFWHISWFKTLPLKDKSILAFLKITLLLSLFAVYFAKSDGAMIAVFAGLMLMAFLAEPMRKLGRIRMAMAALAIVSALLVAATPALKSLAIDRIKLNDFSGQVRKSQWQETGVMLRDGNWLWGAGLANYQEKIAPYHKIGFYIRNDDPDFDKLIQVDPAYQKKYWQPLEIFLYPHNIFLNFWVELGLAGMLLFIWIILKAMFLGFKNLPLAKGQDERFLALGAAVSVFVLMFHGIVDVPYFKNDLAALFWLIISLAGMLNMVFEERVSK